MTRFFYSDPLAAAWMAKHFGMRFISRHELTAEEISVFSSEVCGAYYENPAYIHPDSTPLLEPQVGDLFRFGNRGAVYVCTPDIDESVARLGNIPMPLQWELSLARKYGGDPRLRIIQRNGLAFHYPQSEESEGA